MIPAVVKDQQDRLAIRAIDPYSGAEITIASCSIVVSDAGNNEAIASTGASQSGSLAYYDRSWGFPIGSYRAVWSISDGATSTDFEQYFEVVAHRWRRPIGESDFASKYPYLSGRLPNGSSFANFLDCAWDEIGSVIYGRINKHPGALQNPEQFGYALEMLAVAALYDAIAMQPGSEEASKADTYRESGMSALETVLSCVHSDMDDDLKVEEDDDGLVLSEASLVRMRPRSRRPFKL